MQHPDALMGQNGKYGSPRYNQHTPHRAAWASYCYYAAAEFCFLAMPNPPLAASVMAQF